jgi:predicted O-methyltransferase YrrM
MKRWILEQLQRYLLRSPERRKKLWKRLRGEFESPVNLKQKLGERYPQLAFSEPGHFYSPLPDIEEAVAYRSSVLARQGPSIQGVDLNTDSQLELTQQLNPWIEAFDWPETKTDDRRHYWNNQQYQRADGAPLYAMMQHFKPKRIIEIGSGYSSALMLDTNDRAAADSAKLTFIEPYADRLKGLLQGSPGESYALLEQRVQEVDLTVFDQLEDGDFLFVDSSHVAKAGSDLVHILFQILPRLKPGVLVHFHDIFWPFEYPEAWLERFSEVLRNRCCTFP